MTVWLGSMGLDILFYVNLILTAPLFSPRRADADHDRDFATPDSRCRFFDLLLVGFISGRLDLDHRYVMPHYGFAPAFYIAAGTTSPAWCSSPRQRRPKAAKPA